MNYTNFTVGNETYKLVLTTRTMVELEKKLGKNPIDLMIEASENKLPKVTDMVLILWCSMLKFNHGIGIDTCYDIFDDWVAEGHAYTDFIEVMLHIFETSGLINTQGKESPNEIQGE